MGKRHPQLLFALLKCSLQYPDTYTHIAWHFFIHHDKMWMQTYIATLQEKCPEKNCIVHLHKYSRNWTFIGCVFIFNNYSLRAKWILVKQGEEAILKNCPSAIITLVEVIIAENGAILSQWSARISIITWVIILTFNNAHGIIELYWTRADRL